MTQIKADLCILGAGSGGLSVAAGAAQMGVNVVLIEPNAMGGDCLNTGCVPSKALISAAKRLYDIQHSDCFGIDATVHLDYSRTQQYIQTVIDTIAPHDSIERFEGLGVNVITQHAQFIDSHTVQTDDGTTIDAKKFVIATGSTAAIPNIPGLQQVDYLTNESIFKLKQLPPHLIIIGGGPIGCELGQAYAMFGSQVSIIQSSTILAKEDDDSRAIIRDDLLDCRVSLHEHSAIQSIEKSGGSIRLHYEHDGARNSIDGSHILVAAGRKANVAGLGLETIGVIHNQRGIKIDARCRTNLKHIYAIGDVAGPHQFTHAAGYQAGIVIRNALFRMPIKVDYRAMPWVTYTRLELAHVGLNESSASQQGIRYNKTLLPMKDVDRAVAQNTCEGFIKVLTDKKSRVIGVTVVGEHAGELILPWTLLIQKRMTIKAMTEIITAYPTISDISKRVAGQYYLPAITSKATKRLAKILF